MPEGAEVRKYGESLAKKVSGSSLEEIKILSGRYTKKQPDGIDFFMGQLPGKIIGVGVHGKFLYWILSNDTYIHSTLGMTGHWSDTETKHTRVVFKTSRGNVYYSDQRNFGTLKFTAGKKTLIKKLESLGPDMLSDVTDDQFIESITRKKKWSLAKALMDQSVISGVGNYVKAESLWLSKLSPHRKVESLSDSDLLVLNRSIQTVLKESFQSGGATLRAYKNFDGTTGDYSSRFAVYDKKQDPDGNDVVKEKTEDGRTTHWVPSVQI
jgi:formamidopyrimidine-DNA glycosylase